MRRRLAAAATLCAALLLAACTQQAPKPPPPTSGPTMASDPSTSAAPSPYQSPGEQKHQDFLSVQSVFKAEFDEETRVLMKGGAEAVTPGVRQRTANPYQTVVLNSFRTEKKNGWRMAVGGKLLGITMRTWAPGKVTFQACEDFSRVKTVNRQGKTVKQKPGARTIQKFIAVKTDGVWRIKDGYATIVNTFQNAPCNETWYS